MGDGVWLAPGWMVRTPEVIGAPTHGSGGDPAAVHMGPKVSSPTHPDADADPDPMPAPMACSSLQLGAVLAEQPSPPRATLGRTYTILRLVQ